MRLVGDPELGARLVPALAALGLIAITVWFGARDDLARRRPRRRADARRLSRRVRPGALRHPRHAVHDVHVRRRGAALPSPRFSDRPRLQWLGYLAIALGVQTKGPIALVLCGLTMLLLMALSADLRRRLLALHWASGWSSSPPCRRRGSSTCTCASRTASSTATSSTRTSGCLPAAGSRTSPASGSTFRSSRPALLPWTGLLVGRLDRRRPRVAARGAPRRRRNDALGLDAGHRRVLHAVDVQARSLRVSGGAGAVPAVRARLVGRARRSRRRRVIARSRDRSLSDRAAPASRSASACGYFLIARLDLPRGAVDGPARAHAGRRAAGRAGQRSRARGRRAFRGW